MRSRDAFVANGRRRAATIGARSRKTECIATRRSRENCRWVRRIESKATEVAIRTGGFNRMADFATSAIPSHPMKSRTLALPCRHAQFKHNAVYRCSLKPQSEHATEYFLWNRPAGVIQFKAGAFGTVSKGRRFFSFEGEDCGGVGRIRVAVR